VGYATGNERPRFLGKRPRPLKNKDMKLRRQPRTIVRIAYAMATLQKSRTTINRWIDEGYLKKVEPTDPTKVPPKGKTSPTELYKAQVDELAKEMGIL